MKTYIALLRGINVGGHKKFPKADQLKMLEDLGVLNPQVYLHTGNWIFNSSENSEVLSLKISEAIQEKYSWEVPVLVFKASEIKQILNNCPFQKDIKEKSYFTLLAKTPKSDKIKNLLEYTYPDEEFHIINRCVYFYPVHGAGRAKMSNNFFENKLKVTATSRNFKTMTKIVEFSKSVK